MSRRAARPDQGARHVHRIGCAPDRSLVGIDAFRFLAGKRPGQQLSEQFKTPRDSCRTDLDIVTRLRDAERELQRLRAARLLESAGEIAATAQDISGWLRPHRVPDGTSPTTPDTLALDVRGGAARRAAAVMSWAFRGQTVVVIAVNEQAVTSGLSAATLVGIAARALGGNGGGSPMSLRRRRSHAPASMPRT